MNLKSLIQTRDSTNSRCVRFGIPFLDDCLGGIYPRDLLLVGAATGVGKTALAVALALEAAAAGCEVYLLALEAEVGEVAARLYFNELGKLAKDSRLDYGGWWRGEWKALDRKYGDTIRAKLDPLLSKLHTMYKERGDFTPEDLTNKLEEIKAKAGMIVLDHVHVIDTDLDGENRTQARVVRTLRDVALDGDIPVVGVSHIRKAQVGQRRLVPDLDDLHGSSNLSKVSTGSVIFARDWEGSRDLPQLSPTFMYVPKDRRGRHSRFIARVNYDLSQGRYEKAYQLGKAEWKDRREDWRELDANQIPYWAKNEARNLSSNDIGI